MEDLSVADREPLIDKLLDLYRYDPDAGIHGAAEWTLRRWNQHERIKSADSELKRLKERGDRRWYVHEQGHTFAVINGPVEFLMGSPKSEPDRTAGQEVPRRVTIPHRFAVATKEVTVQQWLGHLKGKTHSV